jgi:hypothetical protein
LQHFLNPLTITSGQIRCHNVLTHWLGSATLGFSVFPVCLRIWSQSKSHSEYTCFKWSLISLFTTTYRTWRWEVIPQGMTVSIHCMNDHHQTTLSALQLIDWSCRWSETMSLNCSHKQAYCSSPRIYEHGKLMEWNRQGITPDLSTRVLSGNSASRAI